MRSPPNKIITQEDEDRIIKLYLEGLSASKIIKALDNKVKTTKTIYDILEKYNIKRKTSNADYVIMNHSYFNKIDNPVKAYVLGWMISDGYINSEQNHVGIQLQEKDKHIIEFIKEEWKTDNKILVCKKAPFEGKNGNIYISQKMHRIQINSKKMVEDLKQYRVIDRKSAITILPLVDYMPDLLRGILDGDGTIYHHSITKKPCIRFIGSHYLVAHISIFLSITLGIKQQFPNIKGNISVIEYYQYKDLEKLKDYLYYKNIDDRLFLSRKREKLENC